MLEGGVVVGCRSRVSGCRWRSEEGRRAPPAMARNESSTTHPAWEGRSCSRRGAVRRSQGLSYWVETPVYSWLDVTGMRHEDRDSTTTDCSIRQADVSLKPLYFLRQSVDIIVVWMYHLCRGEWCCTVVLYSNLFLERFDQKYWFSTSSRYPHV